MTTRAAPLSIESLLQKQKAEKEAASKVRYTFPLLPHTHIFRPQPKFLSKEDRAKLAIEKRAQEIKEQREKDERARNDRAALERDAELIRQREREQANNNRYGGGGSRCQCNDISSPANYVLVTDRPVCYSR